MFLSTPNYSRKQNLHFVLHLRSHPEFPLQLRFCRALVEPELRPEHLLELRVRQFVGVEPEELRPLQILLVAMVGEGHDHVGRVDVLHVLGRDAERVLEKVDGVGGASVIRLGSINAKEEERLTVQVEKPPLVSQ